MNMLCGESEQLQGSYKDPVLLEERRVPINLLTTEDRYQPSPTYFKCVQTDIKPYMRKMVAEWMFEVCEEQKCEEEVFPLAVNHLDRFLSVMNIPRNRLQLLGCVCMLVASKVKGSNPLTAETLIMYTDNSIGIEELMDMELLVLTKLKWDISAISPLDYVGKVLNREKQKLINTHAKMFLALNSSANMTHTREGRRQLKTGSKDNAFFSPSSTDASLYHSSFDLKKDPTFLYVLNRILKGNHSSSGFPDRSGQSSLSSNTYDLETDVGDTQNRNLTCSSSTFFEIGTQEVVKKKIGIETSLEKRGSNMDHLDILFEHLPPAKGLAEMGYEKDDIKTAMAKYIEMNKHVNFTVDGLLSIIEEEPITRDISSYTAITETGILAGKTVV